jgi:hypothetical protein
MGWDWHFWAPLGEALEIVFKSIDPERRPYVARMVRLLEDHPVLGGKAPPPIRYFISRKDVSRIMASVAVDYQRKCKVPLPEALRKVIGRDPIAAKKLEDFRESLRRTKGGPKRKHYDLITRLFKDDPPERAARRALGLYRTQIGKKQKP